MGHSYPASADPLFVSCSHGCVNVGQQATLPHVLHARLFMDRFDLWHVSCHIGIHAHWHDPALHAQGSPLIFFLEGG